MEVMVEQGPVPLTGSMGDRVSFYPFLLLRDYRQYFFLCYKGSEQDIGNMLGG